MELVLQSYLLNGTELVCTSTLLVLIYASEVRGVGCFIFVTIGMDKGGRGMKTIWKFEIPFYGSGDEVAIVYMPEGAEILTVQPQEGSIMMWVKICDTMSGTSIDRKFRILGTGKYFEDENLAHIGTVQQNEFVWHVFEVLNN